MGQWGNEAMGQWGNGVLLLAFGVLLPGGADWRKSQAAVDPQPSVIVWSPTRKLSWEDFRAKPPGGRLTGALSAVGFNYAFGCRDGALHAEIVAEFMPDRSYVADRIITSGLASRAGLEHEQIHFDIAEVYARRVRKFFRELTDACPRADEALTALAQKILKDAAERQRRYDSETHSGEMGVRQDEWARTIRRELTELAAFASAR
jgi:hypothetical protein